MAPSTRRARSPDAGIAAETPPAQIRTSSSSPFASSRRNESAVSVRSGSSQAALSAGNDPNGSPEPAEPLRRNMRRKPSRQFPAKRDNQLPEGRTLRESTTRPSSIRHAKPRSFSMRSSRASSRMSVACIVNGGIFARPHHVPGPKRSLWSLSSMSPRNTENPTPPAPDGSSGSPAREKSRRSWITSSMSASRQSTEATTVRRSFLRTLFSDSFAGIAREVPGARTPDSGFGSLGELAPPNSSAFSALSA